MKKIIGMLAIILVFSCEKLDDTFCWNCIKTTFIKDVGQGTFTYLQDTVVKCEYSELDAQKFENAHTIKARPIDTCGGILRWIDTVCEKQK